MSVLETAALYVAANLLILFWLAVRVIGYRAKGRISIGDGGSEDLAIAMRVHANAAEYIPSALVGLVLLALMDVALWQVHGIGAALTLGRVLHPIGMSRGPIVLRQIGMVGTFAAYIGLVLALVVAAFT